jgi:hypothetical protein
MWRCLVVANQTLGYRELLDELQSRRTHEDDCTFHVVVPATRVTHRAVWTEGEAIAQAARALDDALARFRDAGLEATGEVGDQDPVLAVGDVLERSRFDEIVVSTLPPGASRWLKRDLPNRLRRRFSLTVTHVAPASQPVP